MNKWCSCRAEAAVDDDDVAVVVGERMRTAPDRYPAAKSEGLLGWKARDVGCSPLQEMAKARARKKEDFYSKQRI